MLWILASEESPRSVDVRTMRVVACSRSAAKTVGETMSGLTSMTVVKPLSSCVFTCPIRVERSTLRPLLSGVMVNFSSAEGSKEMLAFVAARSTASLTSVSFCSSSSSS